MAINYIILLLPLKNLIILSASYFSTLLILKREQTILNMKMTGFAWSMFYCASKYLRQTTASSPKRTFIIGFSFLNVKKGVKA